MGRKEEKTPNPSLNIPVDLVEEILVRLPLKPVFKFRIVSKRWRSTLESESFLEKRRRKSKSVQKKNPKVLAVGGSQFQGDSEIGVCNLQLDDAITRQYALTCDGLVCIPVQRWVNVLNPSTGEFVRFASIPSLDRIDIDFGDVRYNLHMCMFPLDWVMGFGRDEVKGSYKVVRLLFSLKIFEILDVHIGEWRKLRRRPPYQVEWTNKSACVNGSIYWLRLKSGYHVLAFDLHTEEFRDLPLLPRRPTASAQIVNLEDRLAITDITCSSSNIYDGEWKLEIWSMDTQQEETTWTMTYSISLSPRVVSPPEQQHLVERWWLAPMAVSKQGHLVLHSSENGLFKYCPETDYLSCLSRDICVITPFVENLVPLRLQAATGSSVLKISTFGWHYGHAYLQPGFFSTVAAGFVARMKPLLPNVLLASTVLSLTIFCYRCKYCSY